MSLGVFDSLRRRYAVVAGLVTAVVLVSTLLGYQQLELIADLRNALKQDKLAVFYQPQVILANSMTIGTEALLRWNHPEHGYIPPEEIIRLGAQTGLVHNVAIWVLTHAVK